MIVACPPRAVALAVASFVEPRMSRALSATAARVGQVTRQVTVERPDFVFATHVARVPGRAAPGAPERAVVPATAVPAARAPGR